MTRRTRKITYLGNLPGTVDIYYNSNWKSVEERRNTDTCAERQHVYGIRGRNDLICRDRYYHDSGNSSSSSCSTSYKERHYALSDAMLSVTAITNTAGTVVERYNYTAFGQTQVMDKDFAPRSQTQYDWQTRFHGEQRDTETGLYNYGYRYYDPVTGRWPSRDPIQDEMFYSHFLAATEFSEARISDVERQRLENPYSFVKNNPILESDYLGLLCCYYCKGRVLRGPYVATTGLLKGRKMCDYEHTCSEKGNTCTGKYSGTSTSKGPANEYWVHTWPRKYRKWACDSGLSLIEIGTY